ncbi:Retrovirus-related Pol polyprotein from transposon TNT 1-94 [Vitis vinifera]|uniref:Retrovirus-related Pol polyprotein from transposon TNT 1-94 n=1 Tax=Vitis vinifera TaxID=29760 RepID=A0A438EI30_VITVI|nr:Retrovirus-related Pol polyprotein from transposon TNT 1-94 [Vitis vinifera]
MLGLWQDLDLNCEEEWECMGDSVRFKKKMENERVFEFLTRLNRELDDVRSRVLSRQPLPSIREVFSEVRREENKRKVMLDLSFGPEASSLLTRGPHGPHAAAGRGPYAGPSGPHAVGSSGPSPRQSKRTYCEHCKKLGHTKDTCWTLHGKLVDWKPRQPNKAYSHQASTETQADKTPTEICIFLTVLSIMSQITPWIIDYGASDHMTDAHHLFSTYSSCAGNLKVKIADGTLSPVAGKGSIRISESITLNPVLHVPNLSCNLLSISQLTKKSNCSAKFLPSHCIFQDLSSGKTIGSAKERGGLYYFDETDLLRLRPPTVCNSASYPKDSELLLWHKRIEGHLNSGGDTELQTNRETLVYSRRPKSKFNETLISEALKELEPVIVPTLWSMTPILIRIQIPKNIQEALEIPEWKEAMMEEMRALEKNETWEVMNLPRGKKPLGCKWTYDIHYTETFAPVAKLNTIRVLLSLVANLDWPLHQFDIKIAFLNGELEKEVFMMLSPGFCKEEEETRVCKLKKSLYGLKQSPRSNDGRMTILIVYVDDIILTGDDIGEVERLKKVLATKFEVKDLGQMRYFLGMEVARSRKGISISQRKYVLNLLTETGMLGCKPSDTPIKARNQGMQIEEISLWSQAITQSMSNDGRMTILIVYVDDIILTGDDIGEVERLKKVLATKFEVKDLGQMRYFLGMEVARSRKGISISQRKYVLNLLTETGMLGCKPSDTPIKARNRMESVGKPVDREKYQRLVGRLIYLSHIRPDIAFAISVVSQYMHSPKESHLEAVYKILRYLKGSPGR